MAKMGAEKWNTTAVQEGVLLVLQYDLSVAGQRQKYSIV